MDRAEEEQALAFAVNRNGAQNLAETAEKAGAVLVHISTDYVFDGTKEGPYTEEDAPNPINVYGASKLAGEEAVRKACRRHLIVRTSWVFSAHGRNFVKTMLRLGKAREEIAVVADQVGKPTGASELARVIWAMLPRAEGRWGTYHVAQPPAVSWHGFAEAIFAEARRQGIALAVRHVRAIVTKDYPTPARRPANSVLDCTKLARVFGIQLTVWRQSLVKVLGYLAGTSN